MIVLLSPSKNMDTSPSKLSERGTQPEFLKSSSLLIKQLSKMSPSEISKLMKISDKLAKLNYDRFNRWEIPFTTSNSKLALLSFTGEVYTGLSVNKFTSKDFLFSQQKLRILSGLYGILKPMDLIQPYRLEMGRNIKTKKAKNLYEFWEKDIADHLEKIDNDTIINLASNEYFKAVNTNKISKKIISPIFKDHKNGQYKIISFYAKKARGLMARYIIQNKINNIKDLIGFNLEGYYYNKNLSTDENPTFIRAATA